MLYLTLNIIVTLKCGSEVTQGHWKWYHLKAWVRLPIPMTVGQSSPISLAHSPPLLRLTSRKPLWLDFQPVDIKSRWRHNWKSAQVVNSHLVCDPTIRQPGFDLPRQQWSLLNRVRTEQGHCSACRRKWRLTYYLTSVVTMAIPVSLWRDPDDVSHCRILFPDKTEWRLISATLCGWRRCFVADHLWLCKRIREEEEDWKWHGSIDHVWLSVGPPL